ncbi:hypothetical protein [Brevibacillus choshinensis]|uniref:DUF4825 domain-containing protein n=1 Tax=Brevibacillus choshinensis TaxID=54911 RepID=A0ABX7FJI7_BRECH|nr:hypothetical protein [Brevibacillus choshinensis]QRG66251.1 hypothetical protein JNE38_22280 [Brevibacillus choshinensis]
MWKKGSALLVAGMLVLTGCSGEASLVRDSIVASIEKPNYDYQGTLKLTGDVDKLPAAFGETETDKEDAAVFAALKAGVTMKGSQLDLKNTKVAFEVNDDKLLRDNKLWAGDKKASVELIVAGDNFYAKSPLDSKYLKVSADTTALGGFGGSDADPAKLKEYQDKMNDLTINFMKKYIAKYGYTLSNAKNLGVETVSLPNGEKVQATHINIKIDAKELVKMFFFTANDAVASKDVKNFAIDMMVLATSLEEEMNPELGKTTEAEKRKLAETTVTEGIKSAKEWLDETTKVYTPEKVVEELKKEGFHGLAWNLDFYIDSAKMPVHQKSELSVTFQTDDLSQPLTVGLAADQYVYNFGKATKYDIPAKDAGLTVEQLYEDEKAINNFSDKGFMRPIAESLLEQHKWQVEWEEELEDADATAEPVAP